MSNNPITCNRSHHLPWAPLTHSSVENMNSCMLVTSSQARGREIAKQTLLFSMKMPSHGGEISHYSPGDKMPPPSACATKGQGITRSPKAPRLELVPWPLKTDSGP